MVRILEKLITPKAVVIVLAFLLVVYGFLHYRPQLVSLLATSPPPAAAETLVGAGDIADCSRYEGPDSTSGEATAELLDNIGGTVFAAGDEAYESGTDAEFRKCYDSSWGRHKARTYPSPGNHEYETANASGYFDYFGAAAGDSSKGYYSYDVGEWHVVVLNSMCENVGGCGDNSPMLRWLKEDLSANPKTCTIAYWHHPFFSSGYHGNDNRMKPTWDALYAANVDVILNGHDHDYERFAPQDPDGVADRERGIREFVVGTGGASLRQFETTKPNSEVRNADTFGVLKLSLYPTSYVWEFVPVAGETFRDSGSDSCH
jgi:3',5'-cyclic AMP phosphodiesterase CpdA